MARIDNTFIRDHFQWDHMSEVKWDMVEGARDAARRVLSNPSKFPNANFAYMERQELECTLFLDLERPIKLSQIIFDDVSGAASR